VIIDNKINVFAKMLQQKAKESLQLLREEEPTRKE
jgi:hypothetical protein